MATPLTATARIVTRYTTNGVAHRYDVYMAYNIVLGQAQMVDRDGITTVLWSLGAQYLWDKVRACMTTAQVPSPATATLESRSGALWNPVAIATLTGAGSAAGSNSPANQLTWVLRDTDFKKVRFMIFETFHGYVYHSPVGASASGEIQAVTDAFSGADVSANAPYRWMKSRGDRFLASTGVVAGLTYDLNDKLKRRRGLE